MPHILISGGSRGIGAAVVDLFNKKGWNVSYIYNSHAPEDNNSETVFAIKCDVSNPDECKNAVTAAEEKFGPVDVLVNNSGISLTGLADTFTYDDYRKVMDTNFGGFFSLSNAVIPSMIRKKSGSIIAISSMWGQVGASCEALYSASKGAVDAYVKSLARELGPSGIRVNAVSPGVVDTDMMNEHSEETKNELADATPLGRLGLPEDIASAVYFLAVNDSAFITGQIIGVNGGFIA